MDDNNILWDLPPDDISLQGQGAHVWAAPLDLPGAALSDLADLLTPEENRRAEAFHFDLDRNRFIAARGVLRTILGRYLHTEPMAITLEYGRQGKPRLAGAFSRSNLHFNLAHCEDLAVLAVVRGRAVGVDVERIRYMEGAQEMADCFCSPREKAEFQSLSPEEKETAFFRLWTRKEAWLKAIGKGIGESLEQVEVSFRAGQPARFIGLPEQSEIGANVWSLHELAPAPGFVAALAVPGQAVDISCWKWKEENYFEYA